MEASAAGVLLAFSLLVSPCEHPRITSQYDDQIKLAVYESWKVGDRVHWCDLKALLVQESGLNPNAVSPVGAVGIAQIMPRTWAGHADAFGLARQSPKDARSAIRFAARYTSWLSDGMTEPRSYGCRRDLILAGYNAGSGNVWKAQRKARANGYSARCFDEIRLFFPDITGRHAEETCRYVDAQAEIRKRLASVRRSGWGRIHTPGCRKAGD